MNVAYAERRGFKVSPAASLVRHGDNVFITEPIAVPCGCCVGCRMDQAKQWKIRLCLEALDFKDKVFFLTLTYRDKDLPINRDGEPYLKKSDVQDFLNRLRNPTKGVHRFYRYFLCGEYGDVTHRPHFHVILFGDLDDLVPFDFGRYRSATIEKAWKHGICEVSPAHPNMMAYVAGYVEKKQCDPLWNDYPVKPFTLKSTKPILGHSYISKVDGSSRHVYGDFGNVHDAPIPRAFLRKLENEPWMEDFKSHSLIIARKSLITSLGAVGTVDQDKLGDVIEESAYRRLEKARISKL